MTRSTRSLPTLILRKPCSCFLFFSFIEHREKRSVQTDHHCSALRRLEVKIFGFLLCSLRPITLVVYYPTFFFFVLSISFVSSSQTYYSKSSVRLLSNCGQKGISETLNKLKSLNSRHWRVNKLNGKATNITFVVKTVNINKMCDLC